MTGINYRDAGPEDAAILAGIGRRTFVETFGTLYSPENLANFLENHSPESWLGELADPRFTVRLAEADGEAVGYAKVGPLAFPVEPQGPAVELRQIYVLKPWQGAGIAAALMDWAFDEARRRGAEELYLSVFVENERARRFYARYGFEHVADYAFMVGDQADHDLIMRLKL
jgi:diamine N-acetyltransferase